MGPAPDMGGGMGAPPPLPEGVELQNHPVISALNTLTAFVQAADQQGLPQAQQMRQTLGSFVESMMSAGQEGGMMPAEEGMAPVEPPTMPAPPGQGPQGPQALQEEAPIMGPQGPMQAPTAQQVKQQPMEKGRRFDQPAKGSRPMHKTPIVL